MVERYQEAMNAPIRPSQHPLADSRITGMLPGTGGFAVCYDGVSLSPAVTLLIAAFQS
jgi:hypothetical protein